MITVEFVILKSKLPIEKGIIGSIWNCSKGLVTIIIIMFLYEKE